MKKILKRKKLIIVLAIIVAAVIALIIYGKNKLSSMAEVSNAVELEEVQKRDLSDFISLTGSVSEMCIRDRGVGVGTIVAALLVGYVSRIFGKLLKRAAAKILAEPEKETASASECNEKISLRLQMCENTAGRNGKQNLNMKRG